ncbi:MAG: aminopeptidase N [Gammaproteobacteria bacterium]|nr:MAG: aminopeptidase N [Gammaproteobacteria bacterium]
MKDSAPKTILLSEYRAPDYAVEAIRMHVDLHDTHADVTTVLALSRRAAQAVPLCLNGAELELQSIELDGTPLDSSAYRIEGEQLIIDAAPAQCQLKTVSRIYPQDNTSLEGLYRSRKLFCTQCEAEGFRKITWYPDRPDVLSLFDVTIEADKDAYPVLLSNGNPVEEGNQGGRHWVRWTDPWPKPGYLFALVAGDLQYQEDFFVTASGRRVQLRIYVEAKDIDKCDYAMDSLKRAMRWDEEVYGREYDLDVFNIVAVDDFNMGAMENKGLNIFNASAVLAHPDVTTDMGYQRVEGIVAHEYFHNWSGNRVTCRDWFQLSLKEGFTVFRDSEFSADMGSRAAKRIEDVALLRSVQFPEDAGPMAHPVQPASYMEISNFYTPTVYEKGSEVVRMMHHLLGAQLFRKGTDLYFDRHDGQAVTIDEFIGAMADVSGRDFSQFRRWYTQSGTPCVKASGEYDATTSTYTLALSQSCPPTPGQPSKAPFHIPVAMGLVGVHGSLAVKLEGNTATTHVLDLVKPEQQFVFTGVTEEPVPSLLRGFSAPVRMQTGLSDEALLFLAKHDDDGFVRYESCQRMMLSAITAQAAHARTVLPASLEGLFAHLLAHPDDDKVIQAMLLLLPPMSFIIDQLEQSDPLALCHARDQMRSALASRFAHEFAQGYQSLLRHEPYQVTGEAMARRQLQHVMLSYWVASGDEAAVSAAVQYYRSADNLTARLAALNALLQAPDRATSEQAGPLLADFYDRWQSETLAMNQWLQIQVMAPHAGLAAVKALMDGPVFQITNPNKVRAVIGAFCAGNAWHFHAADGSGYRFLAEQVIVLNAINPQIASRLITPLTRWQKYTPAVGERMVAALRLIAAEPKLSRDVEEVVLKSLQAAG